MTLSLDSEKALNQFYISLKSTIGNYQTSSQYLQKIPYLFTISCGISDYSPIGMPNLASSEKDATDFLDQTKALFGHRVTARRNYSFYGANVTSDKIQSSIQQIKQLSNDDNQVLVFYYSGHGSVLPQDSTWVMKSLSGDINGKSLLASFSELPGYKIIVLDACYSGILTKEYDNNMAIITSSDQAERSSDGNPNSNSPFTKELIATLEQSLKGKGHLTVEDLCLKVTNWKIQHSFEDSVQSPQAVSGDNISTLLILQ